MEIISLLLMLAAIACFAVAAFARNQPRPNMVALGLMLWAITVALGLLLGLDVRTD